MILFLILSVIGVINMAFFGFFGNNKLSTHFLDYVGLGNLGFSNVFWRDIPFHVGQLTLR